MLADLDRLAGGFTPAEQEVIGRYLRAATELIGRHAERMASIEPDQTTGHPAPGGHHAPERPADDLDGRLGPGSSSAVHSR